MEAIGSSCFSESGLEEITITKDVKRIESGAFENCEHLKRAIFAGEELKTVGKSAFANSGLESFTALPSLERIESDAFTNCKDLKRIDLSKC